MDQVKQQLKQNTAILDPYAAMVPVFIDVSAKVGVNPGLILAGVGSVALLVLMLLQGWAILVTAITVLYPAVHSIRAIESDDGGDDDKVWLTYWMVFGVFNVAETFFGFIFYFIPYWDWLRLALFIWLLLPNFNGSKIIYEGFICSLLKNNKNLIEKWISMTTNAAGNVQKEAMAEAAKAASDPTLLAKGINMANQAQNEINTQVGEDVIAEANAMNQ